MVLLEVSQTLDVCEAFRRSAMMVDRFPPGMRIASNRGFPGMFFNLYPLGLHPLSVYYILVIFMPREGYNVSK